MRLLSLSLAAVLVACGPSEEKQIEIGKDLSKEYAKSACRLYAEEACVQNQSDSCGFSISFDSRGDCSTFMWWGFLSCDDGVFQALWESEDIVQACIAQMDAVDCAADPICDEQGGSVFAEDDCAEMDALMADFCDGDTGW
jgi:hypothetical protein